LSGASGSLTSCDRIALSFDELTVMPFDIQLVSILRALVEVAGFSLLGQGVLGVLAGKYRDQNLFYRVLRIVTQPVVRAVRFITPRFVIDAHIPMLSFFLLFWLWVVLALVKRHLCGLHGLACGAL
jgi:hypothetical protein